MHHKTVVPCEPTWTVTAVSPVDRFIPSSQRCHSYFLTSPYRTQKRSVNADIPAIEEEEEEGRAFGGGRMTTTTTTMAMAMEMERSGGGDTHAAGVRRPMSSSKGGGGGEGKTTNAIRIPRRTNSAS